MGIVRGLQALTLGIGLLGWAAYPYAGTISLDTQVQATVEGETLHGAITLTNRGDEPAYQVQVAAEVQELSWTSSVRERVAVGESHTVNFEQALGGLQPGRYPLIVRIHYTDANRYPFSALTVTEFTVGQAAAPDLLAILEGVTIQGDGRVTLRMKNLTQEPRTVTVRLVLPNELSAEPSTMTKELSADQETQATFRVKNFSALGGSTYPVYAVLEHESDGVHHTTLAAGSVRVESPSGGLPSRPIWLGIFAALLAVLVAINFRHARRAR